MAVFAARRPTATELSESTGHCPPPQPPQILQGQTPRWLSAPRQGFSSPSPRSHQHSQSAAQVQPSRW